ncbi:MAG: flagellar basal body-associated FliL family protein [Firmicutes bacterium]|nr:flagellar basal body-associated FliL family protein [Bacillota bacterium]
MLRRMVGFLVAFLVGAAAGAAGLWFGFPHLLTSRPAPAVTAAFNPAQAVGVTEGDIESNLRQNGHYIRFTVSFAVMPQALKAAEAAAGQTDPASSSGGGSGGTGSAALDARIRNALIDLCLSTSYNALQSPGGLSAFKAAVKVQLEAIFGPGQVGAVYFPTLLTQ